MCGSRYSVDDSLAPIVSRPADRSRSSASADVSSCSRLLNRRACSKTTRPASVSTSSFAPRISRSISFSPSSDSRRCTASDTAGCVRYSFSAAREKLFSDTTVEKTCSAYSSTAPMLADSRISNSYGCANNYKFALSRPLGQVNGHGDDDLQSLHLRHHAARWGAGARLQHDHDREGAHGGQAGGARRGHHGGGFPDRVDR